MVRIEKVVNTTDLKQEKEKSVFLVYVSVAIRLPLRTYNLWQTKQNAKKIVRKVRKYVKMQKFCKRKDLSDFTVCTTFQKKNYFLTSKDFFIPTSVC